MLKTTPISVPKATHGFIEPIVLHLHNRAELQMAIDFGGQITARCGLVATFDGEPRSGGTPRGSESVICPLCAMTTSFNPEQIDGIRNRFEGAQR